jgi:hypothetical protein
MNKLLPSFFFTKVTDRSTDMRAEQPTIKSITAGGVAIQDSAKRKGEEQTSSSYF